jgi:Phage integrase family
VDKIILLLIMMIVRQSTGDAFLPTHPQLAKMANVASADTIWRALLVLRCSRWLTSCQKIWCKGGLLEPSAYVANAKPLPVADTLFLDPEYVQFLKKTVGHTHARVRKIGFEFLSQVPEEIRNRPVEPRTIGAAFTRACRVLEIEDLHFHDLRHEATSRLFETGYSIVEVRRRDQPCASSPP